MRPGQQGMNAAGDPAADDGAFSWQDFDPSEGEGGLFKGGFFGFGCFNPEILHCGGIEDDGIGQPGRIRLRKNRRDEKDQIEKWFHSKGKG